MTQTIIRAPRYERFTILDMRIVEDTRLSWAARGVLAYLLSRPDHWQIQITDLRRRGDLGRDGVYSVPRELRRTGYLHYERLRNDNGQVRGGVYVVTDLESTSSGFAGGGGAESG